MNIATWMSQLGFDLELCGRLCLVLAHSLWQFAALAGLATWVARCWKNATPEQTYVLYAATLLLGLMALPITFVLTRLPGESLAMSEAVAAAQQKFAPRQQSPPAKQVPVQQAAPPDMASTAPAPAATVSIQESSGTAGLLAWAPWLIGCYAAGVAVMLLRLLSGLWRNYRLAGQARPITAGPIFAALRALAHAWSFRVAPALALTERTIVPQVVGLWRPTILLPAAAISGLRPDELEMILAHELAHVRRYDVWMNLVQRLAEAVLFFNPCLWYLSRQISAYREYCCDEATCRLARQDSSATRMRYAQALLRAVELTKGESQGQKVAALAAADSRPSELRRRVARLFGEPMREPVRVSRAGLVTLLAGMAFLFVAPLAWQGAAETERGTKQTIEAPRPTVEVVAIGTHEEEPQRWWDAEGRELKSVPFTWTREPGGVATPDQLWRRVVIHVDRQIKKSPEDRVWEVVGATSFSDGRIEFAEEDLTEGHKSGTYMSRYYRLPDGTKTFDLRVGLAQGPWKTVARRMTVTPLPNASSIIFSDPIPTAHGIDVVVSHNVKNKAYRVVAIDKKSDLHESTRSGGISAAAVSQTRGTFPGLAEDDVDHFEFQTREYEWTEIKDLPVEPGKKTAKVGNGPQKRKPLPKVAVSTAKLASLEELVDSYEAIYERVNALHKAGVEGGEEANKWQAYYRLCTARAEFAKATDQLDEAVDQYQQAVSAAEKRVAAIQTMHAAGRATLGEVLEANRERAEAKVKLSEAQEAAPKKDRDSDARAPLPNWHQVWESVVDDSKSSLIADRALRPEWLRPLEHGSEITAYRIRSRERFLEAAELHFDAAAGYEDAFANVLEGLERDPYGPQIDVSAFVRYHLGDELTIVRFPGKSRDHYLVSWLTNDTPEVEKTLSRIMQADPSAKLTMIGGIPVWKVTGKNESSDLEISLSSPMSKDSRAEHMTIADSPVGQVADKNRESSGEYDARGACVYDGCLILVSDIALLQQVLKPADSGSVLLRQLREAREPILRKMMDAGYKLDDGQVLARLAPPFSPLRMEYYRVGHPSQAEAIRKGPDAMTFHWNNGTLENRGMSFGGHTLTGVLDAVAEIKEHRVEGPEELLKIDVPGDWVVREGASQEAIVEELERILRKELRPGLRLEIRDVEKPVYVARGNYAFSPLPGQEGSEKYFLTDETVETDRIQVFGKELVPDSGSGGGMGDFDEFLEWVGRWIGAPIVDEVEQKPLARVSWQLHQRSPFTQEMKREAHDPDLVLQNISKQTGLEFAKENRQVQMLLASEEE